MSKEFDFQWKQLATDKTEFNINRINEFLKTTKLPRQFFKNKRCLDVGCGNGRYTYAMMTLGADVTSFDISEEAIKVCKTINEKAYVFDISKLKENRIYDFVFCWGVLHHTRNPRENFSKVASQVKKDGMLHIMVYNKKYQYPYEEGRAKWNKWTDQERLDYCKAKAKELKQDVHGWYDALNPKYNFSYLPKEIKKWFEEENFKKIRLTQKANINIQGYFRK